MFRYFGSKASTASVVADFALRGIQATTAADAFGGLGNIGAELKRRGCKVTTCDVLTFPNAFQHARIVCQRTPNFLRVRQELGLEKVEDVLVMLNGTNRASQWFVREYSQIRPFFTADNARRISGAWALIARWNRLGWLSDAERKFVVASLLNSVDACANTAGTYYAYLKYWHRKALRPFVMNWLPPAQGRFAGKALLGDALTCLSGKTFDVLYLDPPYNNRDYSRYYHLPETLAKLASTRIDIDSKAGQPLRRSSEGTLVRDAMKLPYLTELIEAVRWKRLVVQYAEGAYIPTNEMRRMLSGMGELSAYQVSALSYQTKNGSRGQKHHVFVVDR